MNATGVKEIAKRNWLYKIVALILAALLWFYVQAEQHGTQVVSVPLDVVGIEAGMVVEPEIPRVVEVQVRASKTKLTTLSGRDLKAQVDLTGVKPGKFSPEIQVSGPSGVEVLAVVPSILDLTVDVLENKTVPVMIEYTGTMPRGYKLGEVRLEPNTILISGPRSRVRSIERSVVEVPLGEKESRVLNLPVKVIERTTKTGEDQSLRISPKLVQVNIAVAEDIQNKTVNVEVQTVGSPPKGYKLVKTTVEPSTVILSGIEDVLKPVAAINTIPINLSQAAATFTQEAALKLPEGAKGANVSSVKVTLVIEEESKPPTQEPPSGETPNNSGKPADGAGKPNDQTSPNNPPGSNTQTGAGNGDKPANR